MQDYELDAYLGDQIATGDQRERILTASAACAARYSDSDDNGQAENQALAGAVQVILFGVSGLTGIADDWHQRRAHEREAMDSLTGAIIAAAQTLPETQIAEVAGINRLTVRRALGK